jgi:hypothetical protein
MLFQRIQRERNFAFVHQELYPFIKALFGIQADAYVLECFAMVFEVMCELERATPPLTGIQARRRTWRAISTT